MRVAGKEANLTRAGFLYSGFQALGGYNQWPATDTCGWTSYDPRFREWYVGAASGPKDVVIVIDVSGSMTLNGRIGLAAAAAEKLVDTLTDSDYVAIVKFASAAETADVLTNGGTSLLQATDAAKTAFKTWITANINAGGGTNYYAALDKALAALEGGQWLVELLVVHEDDPLPLRRRPVERHVEPGGQIRRRDPRRRDQRAHLHVRPRVGRGPEHSQGDRVHQQGGVVGRE